MNFLVLSFLHEHIHKTIFSFCVDFGPERVHGRIPKQSGSLSAQRQIFRRAGHHAQPKANRHSHLPHGRVRIVD